MVVRVPSGLRFRGTAGAAGGKLLGRAHVTKVPKQNDAARAERRDGPHLTPMSNVTIWYDGSCPLCRREIALMRRLDRRGAIAFVDAADDAAAGCPVAAQERLSRLHAREDGRILSGAPAFAAMWRAIPLLRPLGLIARNRAVLALLERAYLAFLRVRPALQRAARRVERA